MLVIRVTVNFNFISKLLVISLQKRSYSIIMVKRKDVLSVSLNVYRGFYMTVKFQSTVCSVCVLIRHWLTFTRKVECYQFRFSD